MLGEVGLADQRAALRVEADCQQVKHHVVRQLPQLRPVVDGGEGVHVDDAVDRVVLVLQAHVVDLGAEVVAQVRGAGGLDAGEDTLADRGLRGVGSGGDLAHRRPSVDRHRDNACVNDASWSAAADPSRRIGRTVEFHAEIGSTNDRAREALRRRREAATGLAVVADLQTAGRGRRGRTWSSPAGVNLMLSVGVRPRIEAADAGLLGHRRGSGRA